MGGELKGPGGFELGTVVATWRVREAFSSPYLASCVTRHASGEWGDLSSLIGVGSTRSSKDHPAYGTRDYGRGQDAQLGGIQQRATCEGKIRDEERHREADPCQPARPVDVAPRDPFW